MRLSRYIRATAQPSKSKKNQSIRERPSPKVIARGSGVSEGDLTSEKDTMERKGIQKENEGIPLCSHKGISL